VPAPLRTVVSAGIGYRLDGFPPGVHTGLPSRCLTVVLGFDGPIGLSGPALTSQSEVRLEAIAGGLHAGPVFIAHEGHQYGVQLELTPYGCRALFGMPASELASNVVPLGDVLGGAGELHERLALAPSWPARFAVVRGVLARAGQDRDRVRAPRREVEHVWSRLAATNGATSVAGLAREVGWSRRHLSGVFTREFGLAPKLMARVMRFESAVALLRRATPPPLAEVAATCGFADQAHLTRDWHELAGASPSAWAAAEHFPFVQDEDLAVAAS
jgi:AraC-like DNA-binding protein